MARKLRSNRLETPTARLKLPIAWKPVFFTIAPGIAWGYRRNEGAGAWIVRCANGHGGSWTKKFAIADDREDANGEGVLDFWAACERAKKIARGADGSDLGKPWTFAQAIDRYESDLKVRGGRISNARMIRANVPPGLQAKPVSLLTQIELRRWRDGMLERGLQPASVVRICRSTAACLNLAARIDNRIANQQAWKIGLEAIHGANRARNQVLPDDVVRDVVTACYAFPGEGDFGLFVEVL